MIFLLAPVLFIVFLWIAGLLYANDLFLSDMKTETFTRVLLIYPHPDDEVLSAGGLIIKLVSRGVNVTLVTLTEGEKSQRSGLPSFIPFWLAYSLFLFEYYYAVPPQDSVH